MSRVDLFFCRGVGLLIRVLPSCAVSRLWSITHRSLVPHRQAQTRRASSGRSVAKRPGPRRRSSPSHRVSRWASPDRAKVRLFRMLTYAIPVFLSIWLAFYLRKSEQSMRSQMEMEHVKQSQSQNEAKINELSHRVGELAQRTAWLEGALGGAERPVHCRDRTNAKTPASKHADGQQDETGGAFSPSVSGGKGACGSLEHDPQSVREANRESTTRAVSQPDIPETTLPY